MIVRLVISANDVEKKDIRSLVQSVREWELNTPNVRVVGILFETEPKLDKKDSMEVFSGIYPSFQQASVPAPAQSGRELWLGTRAIVIKGEVVGMCSDMSLNLAQASESEILLLENAQSIVLERMGRG